MLYERCERDSNPQSAFADHRFSGPARYHLRHHSIVSGTGFEPASPKGHMILSHARFPVSHPDKEYRRRDSNPQNTAFEAGTYSIPSLLQNIQVPLAGFEPAKARILSPAHIPVLLQRHILFWFLSHKARMWVYRTVLPKGVEPSLSRV